MSNLRPSFNTLYRQARPVPHPGQKTMQQYERFATASLGFALQHDLDFRQDFLKTICEYCGPLPAQAFEVSLEIDKCGDLALRAADETFIIEAKINARLHSRQNPCEAAFFDSGYGHHIVNSYPGKRTYIVLWQAADSYSNPRPEKLHCVAKHWNELLSKISRRGPIVADLFKSLGPFGVRCFAVLDPMTDLQNLASKIDDACQLHAVLDAVAEHLKRTAGLPVKKESSDFMAGRYIGWDLSRKKADPKWIKFIAPKAENDEISWFGYSNRKLNVGFYCERGTVEGVRAALNKGAVGFGKVKNDDTYLWIESNDGGPKGGDKEWFMAIYDGLSKQIGLH